VTVGGVLAPVLNYTDDVRDVLLNVSGLWYGQRMSWDAPIDGLVVVFPSYNASCVHHVTGAPMCEGSAAYKQISVQNGEGGVVSCPPHCPGYANTMPGSSGAFYTSVCVGFESGPSCLDASTAGLCGVGSGDSCRRCPKGAFCPGGSRLWPQPGYWIPSESALSVAQCDYPPLQRCLGWNASVASSQCGVGYTGASLGCSACDKHYFPELSECRPCPPPGSSKVKTFGMFLGIAVAAFGVVVLVVIALSWRKGGKVPVVTSVFRGRDFVSWVMLTWQTIVQVSKRATKAPPTVRSMYAALAVLELDSAGVLHPACFSSYPFTLQMMEFAGSMAVMAVCLTLFRLNDTAAPGTKLSKFQKLLPTLRRMSMTTLLLTYPLICNGAFSMLRCTRDKANVLVLASNPMFRCYTGDHALVAGPAWIAMIGHVWAFPIITLFRLVRRGNKVAYMAISQSSAWGTFTAQDFQPHYYWFVHLNMLTVLVLSVLFVFLPTTPTTPMSTEVGVFLVTTFMILANIGLIFWFQPYTSRREWKKPVKFMALMVTLASAVANLVCAAYQKGRVDVYAADASSFAVFGCVVLLILAFFFFFWRAVWVDARQHVASIRQSFQKRKKSGVFVVNPMAAVPRSSGGGVDSNSRVFTTRVVLQDTQGKQTPKSGHAPLLPRA
jgi:hypothetical protein